MTTYSKPITMACGLLACVLALACASSEPTCEAVQQKTLRFLKENSGFQQMAKSSGKSLDELLAESGKGQLQKCQQELKENPNAKTQMTCILNAKDAAEFEACTKSRGATAAKPAQSDNAGLSIDFAQLNNDKSSLDDHALAAKYPAGQAFSVNAVVKKTFTCDDFGCSGHLSDGGKNFALVSFPKEHRTSWEGLAESAQIALRCTPGEKRFDWSDCQLK